MVLPDFLIRLLEILHLKDSELTKMKKLIAQCDENIRSLNHGLEQQVKQIKDLEEQFKELKVQYDAASGPVRETLAVRMKNILKQRERMGEQRQMSEQQLEAESLARHNYMLQLEYLQHPDNHDMEFIREEKEDIIHDMAARARTMDKLENTTIPKKDEKEMDFDKAPDAGEDPFKGYDLSFMTPGPEKDKKEEEKKEEEKKEEA